MSAVDSEKEWETDEVRCKTQTYAKTLKVKRDKKNAIDKGGLGVFTGLHCVHPLLSPISHAKIAVNI